MPRWLCVPLFLVASTSNALAQERVPEKKPSTALVLSISTTLVGTAVLLAGRAEDSTLVSAAGLAGMFVGPSTGQWYAGQIGAIGLGARAAAAVLVVRGYDTIGHESLRNPDAMLGKTLLVGGLGLWVGSSVFDVVMAYRATTAWNREHAVRVGPTVLSGSTGRAPGISLSIEF